MSRKTRKLIWSAPLVAVLAVAGALTIFVALAPNAAFADHEELPGPVTGLKAEADGRTMMDLSWNAPTNGGDATHYRIDRSDDTYTWKALAVTTDTATTHTDTGLKPARTYYYRVFAVNSSGISVVSIEENYAFDTTASVEAPGTLALLSAVAKSDTQIDLMWRAPSQNGGASITQYCIVVARARAAYEAPTPANCVDVGATANVAVPDINGNSGLVIGTPENVEGNTVIVVDADDGTKYEHKSLEASRTLHYWVHAVNSAGLAPVASNPASATTKSTPTLGPAPRNLRGVADGVTLDGTGNVANGSVMLYWNVPTGTEPVNTDQYTVEYSLNGSTWEEAIDDHPHGSAFGDTAGVAQYDHTGIASLVMTQKALYYRIKIANGRWSTSTRVNLIIERARPDSLALEADGSGTDAVAKPTSSLNASSNEYLTRIDLKWAFEADDYPREGGPPVLAASPRPTGYLIDYYIGADDATNIYWQPLQSNTGYARGTYNHIRGLKPGQTVHYRVFSWHTNNYGIPAATMGSTKAAVSPDPVRGLRTMADGPTKIKLDWDAVPSANSGGSPITHYVIQVHENQPSAPDGGLTGTGWNRAGSSTSTTFTFSGYGTTPELNKLTAEEGAWFRVFAVNSVNKDALDAETFNPAAPGILADITSAEPKRGETARAEVPLVPQDLTTEPAKDANSDFSQELGILLLWNAPDDPAGATVTGYTISRRVKPADGEWGEWDDAWGSITADDLLRTYYTDTDEPDEGEERAYRVLATSARGDSDWSEMAYAPTVPGMHNTAPMRVGTIAAVTVAADQMSEMDVSGYFSDADMGDTLKYTAMSDMEMYATVMVSDSMLTITGVAAGMATITVTATDAAGAYAMQTIMVTVEAANTPPMAVGTIAPVTVTADEMSDAMDVSVYFSDADMDVLTYRASSDMMSYATASVSGSMVTITGVAAGTATITVTATDPDGAMATQTIMVTVEAASMELTAPTGVSGSLFAGSSIIVSWDADSTQNADLIVVALFNEGVTALANIPKNTHPISLDAMDDPGTYSFDNVPSGTYKVAVASESGGVYKVSLAAEVVTVP